MLSGKKPKVLVVDDEIFNLEIMSKYLHHADFDVIMASDGDMALQKLAVNHDVDVVVLDRMMPKVTGMEVVKVLRKDKRYQHVPIVMQTAAARTDQVMEGIDAGVYYYLTKPYKGQLLVSIVKAALEEGFKLKEIENELKNTSVIPTLIEKCEFEFRTTAEAKSLAFFLSNSFPDPSVAAFGLTELMVNAIEHGNLGITFAEKTKFVLEGTIHHEVERRLGADEHKHKKVYLSIELVNKHIKIYIKDSGEGFDWKHFLEISPERATSPNGRGIAHSKACFTTLEYLGKGNEVVCTTKIGD